MRKHECETANTDTSEQGLEKPNADFCSLRGKIIGGRRMMASKLNCRCQSLPCSCPAFPCVPGQREEILVVQEGGKDSRKTAPGQPTPSRAVGPARRDHNTSPVPILSVPPQSLQHTDMGTCQGTDGMCWFADEFAWICIHLPLSLHSFPAMPLRTSKTLSALNESNFLL